MKKNSLIFLDLVIVIFLLTFSFVFAQEDLNQKTLLDLFENNSSYPINNTYPNKILSTNNFSVQTQVANNQIELEVTPQKNITAHSSLTLSLKEFGFNLDSYQIDWIIDGEIEKSGLGEKTFNTTAGDYGESKDISAVIHIDEVNLITKKITIQPEKINLLWESTTSTTPPFYKGKSLPNNQDIIKVVAMSESTKDSVLNYIWRANGHKGALSKYNNKNTSFIPFDPIFLNNNVRVEISNSNGTTKIQKSIFLSPQTEQVVIYPKTNLGIEYAHPRIPPQGKIFSLVAQTFNFSTKGFTKYTWQTQEVNTTTYKPEFTPKKLPTNELVLVTVKQTGKILSQSASTNNIMQIQ